ncbi:MAG: hypothetical protein RL762_1800, partial [Bacteroidota bacterium]
MIRIYLALFFLWLFQNVSYAQFCSTPTTNIAITPTGTVQQTAIYNTGVRAFNFTATAGCTYTFSTCGLSTIDTKLRLYNAALATIGSADNGCSNGIQAEMIWLCPAGGGGQYTILLTKYNCLALDANTKLAYSVNCSVPCTAPPVVNAGQDFSICSGAQAQLNASVQSGNTSTGANLTITLTGQTTLNETSWSLSNASGVIGSGGPYLASSSASQTFPVTSNATLSFYIETQGSNNNNALSYTISCNNVVINSGNLAGGQTSTIPVTNCTVGANTAPITYSWTPSAPLNSSTILNPTATITTATTFTLTATQGSCVVSDQILVGVAQTPNLIITSASGTTVTCNTSLTLTASGASSYAWYNNGVQLATTPQLVVTQPGWYSVTGSNGINCQDQDSIYISADFQAPVAAIANNPSTTVLNCSTTSIVLTASGGNGYSWS